MAYRYSYSRMLCYALLCMQRQKEKKKALEILLRVRRKKEERSAHTNVLLFVKRQKANPGISQHVFTKETIVCDCHAVALPLHLPPLLLESYRTLADGLLARQRDHGFQHRSPRTARSVDTTSGTRTWGASVPQSSCTKPVAVTTVSPSVSTCI